MAIGKIGFSEGAGVNIATYSFIEAGRTVHVERIAPSAGVTGSEITSATVIATGLVLGLSLSCPGRGRIVVTTKAEAANTDFCTFRLLFKNSEGTVLGMSVLAQSSFVEHSDGGTPNYRYGTVTVFSNDCGASSVEVYVVQLPTNGSFIIGLTAV